MELSWDTPASVRYWLGVAPRCVRKHVRYQASRDEMETNDDSAKEGRSEPQQPTQHPCQDDLHGEQQHLLAWKPSWKLYIHTLSLLFNKVPFISCSFSSLRPLHFLSPIHLRVTSNLSQASNFCPYWIHQGPLDLSSIRASQLIHRFLIEL